MIRYIFKTDFDALAAGKTAMVMLLTEADMKSWKADKTYTGEMRRVRIEDLTDLQPSPDIKGV